MIITPQQKVLVTSALDTLNEVQMLQNMALSTEVSYEYSIQTYASVLSNIIGELGFILNNLNNSIGN